MLRLSLEAQVHYLFQERRRFNWQLQSQTLRNYCGCNLHSILKLVSIGSNSYHILKWFFSSEYFIYNNPKGPNCYVNPSMEIWYHHFVENTFSF